MFKKLSSEKIISSDEEAEKASHVGGVCEKTLGTVEREKVMIKGNGGDFYESLSELLAYRLGTAIGLKVNKVEIVDCGDLFGLSKIASVHWWVNRFIPYRHTRDLTINERTVLNFFDEVFNNDDRNSGNYGLVDGELFLIDHGFASPWANFETNWNMYATKEAVKSPYCLPFVENFMKLSLLIK